MDKELKFKVGDWIYYQPDDIVVQIPDNGTLDDLSFEDNEGEFFELDFCEHWHPKPGEWCWFYDDDSDIAKEPFIAKFKSMACGRFQVNSKNTHTYSYQFCQPFIGTLPTNLKD